MLSGSEKLERWQIAVPFYHQNLAGSIILSLDRQILFRHAVTEYRLCLVVRKELFLEKQSPELDTENMAAESKSTRTSQILAFGPDIH